ncbi:MAG: type II secretion system protein [Sulfuriferula sp.]
MSNYKIHKPTEKSRGFTLVEMLIVAPIVILTIGAFITVIVSMTGQVLATRSANALAYDIQDSLNRIEQDVKLSTTFLAKNNVTLTSPQGYNDDTTDFTNVGVNGNVLILNTLATSDNPYVGTSGLIYLQDQPNACASTQVNQNTPLTLNVAYFVKNNTLWRRVIMPANYATAGCSAPWQLPSCSSVSLAAFCKVQDIKLVEGVSASDFHIDYFTTGNGTIANSVATDSASSDAVRGTTLQSTTTISASITANKTAAGREITQSGTIRSTRLDINASTIAPVVAPTTPAAPVVTAVSAGSSAPSSATFSWPSVAGAQTYTIEYNINGGSWQSGFSNQSTTTYTVDGGHNNTVNVRVTATNTAGTSGYGNASLTIPLWATPVLQNTWTDYLGAFTTSAFTKTSEGVVVFKGLIKRTGSAVAGEVLFQLPVGYRPNLRQVYTTMTNSNVASRVDVDPNGNVLIQSGSAGWLSLDGIKFVPTATTAISFQAMTLSSSWVNYDGGVMHQVASYAKDTLNRTFTRGLIKNGSTAGNALLSSLSASPINYQSPSYQHLPTYGSTGFGMFSPAQTNTTYPGAGIQFKSGGNGYFSIESMFYNNYTGWTALPLVNGWTWYSATGIFATPAYNKAADGVVSLKGLITAGTATSGTVIANLPVGYRPKAQLLFEVANNGAAGRVDILANGQVQILTGGNTWLALDSINFIAEQ